MAAWADSDERFVEIPGIVEIRWVSDDPDYYVAPIDLFDEQKNGLPDFYGKKDKTTTEQPFFTCNVCECDLKSVVTLRAHCKGTQHIRKALQKKKEWRVKLKKEARANGKTERFNTLFEWLDQGTSEAVVGLEHVTEYLSGDSRDIPYYYCDLSHCRDEQGNAEMMKNHMLTGRHKQAWLEMKTGSFLKHQTEISQRIAEFTKDFKRDFRDMKVKEDRVMWNKAREGRISLKRKEEVKAEREWSPIVRNIDRERDRGQGCIKVRDNYERERSPMKKERREESYGRENVIREERREYAEREPWYKREQGERESSTSPKRDMVKEGSREVEEVKRSGNFENWRTAIVKVDTNVASTSKQVLPTPTQEKSVIEEVERLHRKVANKVMKILNKFYPGAEEFDPIQHKIGSPDEYSRLAKKFSHQLRSQIKESYEAYHGILDGITLTGDHEQFIRTEVESYFEGVPQISK